MSAHDFLAGEIAGLNLPPNYEVQSRAYGPVIVDRTTDRLVLVATRSGSKEWLEDAAWNDYADYIHDRIVERRVAVELVSARLADEAHSGEHTRTTRRAEELARAERGTGYVSLAKGSGPELEWYEVRFRDGGIWMTYSFAAESHAREFYAARVRHVRHHGGTA